MVDETRNSVSGQARVETVVQAGSVGEVHFHQSADTSHETAAFQLPPDAAHFVNRDAEQASVARAVQEHRGTGGAADGGATERPLVVAVHGLRGVGKTALGVRLARGLAEEFPDALRFVDLDDHRRDGGVETAEVLGELLRSLGVRPDWVEPSYAGRRRQYWARTRGRRLVLVVDNVRFGLELEQLMPASADSVVIAIGQGQAGRPEGRRRLGIPLGRSVTNTPHSCCGPSPTTRASPPNPRRPRRWPGCAAACPPRWRSRESGCASTAGEHCCGWSLS